MDYQKIYSSLIEKRHIHILNKTHNGTVESHHIIPMCMGGVDDESNLINLTCREHRFAHLLLCKIYPNNFKLLCAALNMNYAISKLSNRTTSKSRIFQLLREKFSEWNIKHKSRYVEWDGEIHTIREWSEIKRIPYNQFRMLFYRGHSIEHIMNKSSIDSKKYHLYKGKYYGTKELSKIIGKTPNLIKRDARKGIPMEVTETRKIK